MLALGVLVAALGGLLVIAGIGTCLTGCASGLEEQTMVSAYGADQIECVYVANDRGQADSCRTAVKNYWCGPEGPLREAGACTFTPPTDGGSHP